MQFIMQRSFDSMVIWLKKVGIYVTQNGKPLLVSCVQNILNHRSILFPFPCWAISVPLPLTLYYPFTGIPF